jgi:hypothetical protein
MAGLDTRGFVSGGVQGYSLAQNQIDTERRRDNEDQQLEWQVQDRETAAQDRRRTIGIQDEQMGWQRENQAFQSRKNTWAEYQQDFKPIMANLQTSGQLSDEEWGIVGKGVKDFPGRLPTDLSDMWRSRQAEIILPTIQQLMTDPQSVSTDQIDQMENMPVPLSHAIGPEQDQALAVVGDLMDPETETNMRSPQVIDAANRIFGPRLGEGKRISGIMPGKQPGTLVFELEVSNEDGSTRNAPMTRNRGTVDDEDNEVLQVPVEDLMNEIQDAMAIKSSFDQNPEAAKRVMQHAISQGYIAGGGASFEIRELPNGRYGQFDKTTGELVKELSADEANKNGPGGGGGLDVDDARLWYKDTNTIFANQFGLQLDEFGNIVGEGGPGLETATVHSSLATQLWDQGNANGVVMAPSQVATRVLQAAGNAILNRDDAIVLARKELNLEPDSDEMNTELREKTNQILMEEYNKVRATLGLVPDSELVDQYDQGESQPSGQNWIAPMKMPGQQTNNALPGRDQVLEGSDSTRPAGLSDPRSINQNPELTAASPVGRKFEKLGNLSSRISGVVNDTAGYVGDMAASTATGIGQIPGRAEQNKRYADWVRQVEQFIGGGSYAQAFQAQSDQDFNRNKQIIAFLRSGRGRQILAESGKMQKAFTQDPDGFMYAVEQGMEPNEIVQFLSGQGRIETPPPINVPR